MKSALIVRLKSGKKGYVYFDDNAQLKNNKLQVKIIDEEFQETGEKLLCSHANLVTVGYKD